jgi:predicted nuclease of restriction endonuclease-like (RecB) superfamily
MRAATPQIARSIFTNDTVNFLGPKGQYIERDFEDAILRELEMFLLELGAGFSFIARQKRIQIHGEDFYIDLLIYNRKLKRLVAVKLKQGSFRAEADGTLPPLAGEVRERGR